ncbi:MAG: hypothetical protein POH28_16860, partial [Acidocella sp.]|nr:hypothetical protein [Acidocella sp.]
MNNNLLISRGGAAGLATVVVLSFAGALPARATGAAPMMMAQAVYPGAPGMPGTGGAVYPGAVDTSQDSIMPAYSAASASSYREVEAAETHLGINASFMHTQYHENLPEGTGDDENGLTAGFGVGASVLLPEHGLLNNADYYAALKYDFAAGNLYYGGHYLASGLPASATDRAVFNRIEGRLGIGLPQKDGVMVIPFFAFG